MAVVVTFLTGCGPTSIRSRLPHLPHIALLAKTSPVKTAAASLLLPTRVLFPHSQVVVPARADDALVQALKSSADGNLLRTGLVDEASAAYLISTQPFTPTPRVQVAIDRYLSTRDAVAGFQALTKRDPAVDHTVRLGSPGIGSRSARFRLDLPAFIGDIVYVQDRNIILRVYTATPRVDPNPSLGPGVATAEDNAIGKAD